MSPVTSSLDPPQANRTPDLCDLKRVISPLGHTRRLGLGSAKLTLRYTFLLVLLVTYHVLVLLVTTMSWS